MLHRNFTESVVVPGTLAADVSRVLVFPYPVQLVGVSGRTDNTTSFILDIGTEADPDAYLDGVTITGAATGKTQFGRTDFVGDEYPHIPENTPIKVSVDFDGGAGGNSANVDVQLYFTQG